MKFVHLFHDTVKVTFEHLKLLEVVWFPFHWKTYFANSEWFCIMRNRHILFMSYQLWPLGHLAVVFRFETWWNSSVQNNCGDAKGFTLYCHHCTQALTSGCNLTFQIILWCLSHDTELFFTMFNVATIFSPNLTIEIKDFLILCFFCLFSAYLKESE